MTYVPKLFCGCGAEMKTAKIGEMVEVFIRAGDDGERPYYKISADRLQCVSCGKEVLLNAPEPVAMTFSVNYPNFTATRKARL